MIEVNLHCEFLPVWSISISYIYIYIIYIFNRNLPYFLDTPNCVILNDQLELDLDDIIIK